jgi:LysM repeat protein
MSTPLLQVSGLNAYYGASHVLHDLDFKVQAGQTLYSISKAYGMDVATLKRLNGLRSNNLTVGRLLRVR